MKYVTFAVSAALFTSATVAFGATDTVQPDHRSWALPTASSVLSGQIDLQWGSTELIEDGGFENDGWAGAARTNTHVHTGSYSLSVAHDVFTSQIVVVEPTADYTVSAYGSRIYPGLPQMIVSDYDDVSSSVNEYFSGAGFESPDIGQRTLSVTTGATNESLRVYLANRAATGADAYFDDVSVRPTNLYVYRSTSEFTNTGDATLIHTLDGLTSEGYSDTGLSGTYWYAITSTSSALDVTSIEATAAVPEPASLSFIALSGVMLLGRRRAKKNV